MKKLITAHVVTAVFALVLFFTATRLALPEDLETHLHFSSFAIPMLIASIFLTLTLFVRSRVAFKISLLSASIAFWVISAIGSSAAVLGFRNALDVVLLIGVISVIILLAMRLVAIVNEEVKHISLKPSVAFALIVLHIAVIGYFGFNISAHVVDIDDIKKPEINLRLFLFSIDS